MKYTTAVLLAVFTGASYASEKHDDDSHQEAEAVVEHGHADHDSVSPAGKPGTLETVTKTISVDLVDQMKLVFDPAADIDGGDVVKFDITNVGKIRHEFSIGTESEQKEHRKMMQAMPNMKHDDPNTVTLEPGESKSLIWAFNEHGKVVLSCNIPGHSEAGMIENISIH